MRNLNFIQTGLGNYECPSTIDAEEEFGAFHPNEVKMENAQAVWHMVSYENRKT